jgi:hypothetical protein
VLVFWLFVIGIPVVVLAVLGYAALTVEKGPTRHRPPTAAEKAGRAIRRHLHRPHRKPLSRRQQARKDAARAEWAARRKRVRGLLRRPERSPGGAAAPASLVTGALPEKTGKDAPATDPGGFPVQEEPGEDWATDLRAKLAKDEEDDPDKHLRRNWEERTGVWERQMLDKMLADGQMPPADKT